MTIGTVPLTQIKHSIRPAADYRRNPAAVAGVGSASKQSAWWVGLKIKKEMCKAAFAT